MLKTRFAPTPSGLLHIGNGASFVATWALARAWNAKILLRIDDLDAARMRPEYVEDIFRTIDWLGIDYDEGATSVTDFMKHHSQIHRLDLYQNALENGRKTAENSPFLPKIYACDCSRRQIRIDTEGGVYRGTCLSKNLSLDAANAETAWRIHVASPTEVTVTDIFSGKKTIDLATAMGDFVMRQKNKMPSYQVASVIDDVHFGVNMVVRGADLWDSTAAQYFIAPFLGAESFHNTRFFHHALLTENNQKLSKSAGAAALQSQRLAGKPPKNVIEIAAKWLGADVEIASLNDLLTFAKGLRI